MLISILTAITSEDPRLEAMASCILGNVHRAPMNVEVEWILAGVDMDAVTSALEAAEKLHGKDVRLRASGAPSHKRERPELLNACLVAASFDSSFAAVLDEKAMPCRQWLAAVIAAAASGLALRYQYQRGLLHPRLTGRGEVLETYVGPLVPADARGMKGQTGGYPISVLRDIQGWDESYQGGFGFEDADLALRAERAGCKFRTTPRAAVYELSPGTPKPGTVNDEREEQKRLNALVRDRDRTMPAVSSLAEESAEPTSPAPDSGRPEPKRPPRPAHRKDAETPESPAAVEVSGAGDDGPLPGGGSGAPSVGAETPEVDPHGDTEAVIVEEITFFDGEDE